MSVIVTGECVKFFERSFTYKSRVMCDEWNAARRIMGLTPHNNTWSDFFDVKFTETTKCRAHGLTYKDVWKCGNNFFQGNLVQKCKAAVSHSPVESSGHPLSTLTARRPIFAFVRDPKTRFFSAYREVAYRLMRDCCIERRIRCDLKCSLLTDPNSTVELAREIVVKLVQGAYEPWFAHFSLMSAFLYSRRPFPAFVGRLENVSMEWDDMCDEFDCPEELRSYSSLNKNTGKHELTSSDAFGHGKGLSELFSRKPEMARAIWRLYDFDFRCFGY